MLKLSLVLILYIAVYVHITALTLLSLIKIDRYLDLTIINLSKKSLLLIKN